MTINVRQAAKHICKVSNWTASNLFLQKILYLSHMIHLGRHREPLVSGEFQAWDYGPVHPDLYHSLSAYGSKPVQNIFLHDPDLAEDSSEIEALNFVYERLGHVEPWKLVALTHRDQGAWARVYNSAIRNTAIPNEFVIEEYKEYQP